MQMLYVGLTVSYTLRTNWVSKIVYFNPFALIKSEAHLVFFGAIHYTNTDCRCRWRRILKLILCSTRLLPVEGALSSNEYLVLGFWQY